jgi:hypothetical protein
MPGVVGVRKELGGGAYQQGFADEIRVRARHHSPRSLCGQYLVKHIAARGLQVPVLACLFQKSSPKYDPFARLKYLVHEEES